MLIRLLRTYLRPYSALLLAVGALQLVSSMANLYLPSLNAGQFAVAVSGLPGLAVNIESSADLIHWQLLGTYVLYGGTNEFIYPTPPPGIQFYRGHVR